MLSHYPATMSSIRIHDLLHEMYDGQPIVAVEVFGPPEAMGYSKSEDTETGPWVLGPRDEVHAHVEETGFDYSIQYEISHEDE